MLPDLNLLSLLLRLLLFLLFDSENSDEESFDELDDDKGVCIILGSMDNMGDKSKGLSGVFGDVGHTFASLFCRIDASLFIG